MCVYKRDYETYLKSFDKKITTICAGYNRRFKIAETLSLFESLAVLDAKDLIYATNICTSLTTNERRRILHTACLRQCKNERRGG